MNDLRFAGLHTKKTKEKCDLSCSLIHKILRFLYAGKKPPGIISLLPLTIPTECCWVTRFCEFDVKNKNRIAETFRVDVIRWKRLMCHGMEGEKNHTVRSQIRRHAHSDHLLLFTDPLSLQFWIVACDAVVRWPKLSLSQCRKQHMFDNLILEVIG